MFCDYFKIANREALGCSQHKEKLSVSGARPDPHTLCTYADTTVTHEYAQLLCANLKTCVHLK
jgi:hypothetical protein